MKEVLVMQNNGEEVLLGNALDNRTRTRGIEFIVKA